MELNKLLKDQIKIKFPQSRMIGEKEFGFHINDEVKIYLRFSTRYIFVNLEIQKIEGIDEEHIEAFFCPRLEKNGVECVVKNDGIYIKKTHVYSKISDLGVFKDAMEYYSLFNKLYNSYLEFQKLTKTSNTEK